MDNPFIAGLLGESSVRDDLRKDHAIKSKSPKRYMKTFEEGEDESDESTEKEVINNIRKVDFKDRVKVENVSKIDQWTKDGRKYPVYLLFNDASSMVSKSIRFLTMSKYSHVSISTQGLTEFVSFGDNNKNDGMVLEGFWELLDLRKPNNIKLTAIMVDAHTLKDLQIRIENHKRHINKMKYSYKDLISFPFLPKTTKVKNEVKYDFVCSQFVAWLLASMKNGSGFNPLDSIKNINISPKALDEALNLDTYTVFEGALDDFKPKLVADFEKGLGIVKDRKDIIKEATQESINKLYHAVKDGDAEYISETPHDVIDFLFNVKPGQEFTTPVKSRVIFMSRENINKLEPDEIIDKLTEIFNNGQHRNEYRKYIDILIEAL